MELEISVSFNNISENSDTKRLVNTICPASRPVIGDNVFVCSKIATDAKTSVFKDSRPWKALISKT